MALPGHSGYTFEEEDARSLLRSDILDRAIRMLKDGFLANSPVSFLEYRFRMDAARQHPFPADPVLRKGKGA